MDAGVLAGERMRPLDGYHDLTTQLVRLGLVLAGYNLVVGPGASAALALVLALTPVWIGEVREYVGAMLVIAATLVAVGVGVYLASLSQLDHRVDVGLQRSTILHLLSGLSVMIVVLWGRRLMPLHQVAGFYGFGAVANAFLNTGRDWKFDLATPLAIFLTGSLAGMRNRLVPAGVLCVLGLYVILDEGRSFFGFCVVAATMTIWQARPSSSNGRPNRWYPLIVIAGTGFAIYSIASSLLTRGYFGPVLQQRSVAQIDATGSLISGGRPEWSAARALLQSRPRGFGVGVVPNFHDVIVAKSGLASINVDTGGYLTHYMLGGQFRLHSVTSDLWVSYGVAGLALAGIIVYLLARNTSTAIAERRAATVTLFACTVALWHMAFGPIYSNWRDVCFALGLSLTLSAHAGRAGDGVGPTSTT